MTKEIPILFSTPMVKSILSGSKTQTRRIVKPQPIDNTEVDGNFFEGNHKGYVKVDGHGNWQQQFAYEFCPYGKKGDILWVRETWAKVSYSSYRQSNGVVQTRLDDIYVAVYKAGWERSNPHWKPSIHMPKVACRIFLEITDIRVERLQDISEEDAIAEGIIIDDEGLLCMDYIRKEFRDIVPEESFETLWQSINGEESWNQNPWVFVIEFERIEL